MFRIGQKVVCVDASPYKGTGRPNGLVLNAVYTVAKHHEGLFHRLVELVELPTPDMDDNLYLPIRFRPVVEKKTDISVFTEILRRETIDDGPVVAKPRTRVTSDSGLSHD